MSSMTIYMYMLLETVMSHCIIVGDCDVTLPPLVMHEQYDYIHVHVVGDCDVTLPPLVMHEQYDYIHVHVVGDCDVTLHHSWRL